MIDVKKIRKGETITFKDLREYLVIQVQKELEGYLVAEKQSQNLSMAWKVSFFTHEYLNEALRRGYIINLNERNGE